jgi:photosystem II stability/assembly factor-like uncharacterized protein
VECSIGFMTAVAGAGVKAHVYYTLTGGATWTVCAADPFAINEDINSCECFYISRDTIRVIVGRSTTDGANPPEIAYSDNFGVSWTTVNIGATVAEYLYDAGSLFALDYRHVWAGTNAGKLWLSDDGGVTWTLKLTSSIANGIYSIRFRDEVYGLISGGHLGAGCILYSTSDGGDNWTLLTPNLPAAEVAVSSYTCDLVDNNRFWVGYVNAHLYYSNDAGLTWTRRYLPMPVGMTALFCIYGLQFLDEQCVFIGVRCTVGAVAYGVVFRSIDGGFSWESWVGVAAAATIGISAIHPCSYNKCYWVGGPVAALGTVAVVSG